MNTLFLRLLIALATILAASKGHAQVLWRDLEQGDSPSIVEQKLSAMTEVKRVKTIMRKGVLKEQDINMNEGGVMVFDAHLAIETEYARAFSTAAESIGIPSGRRF